MALLIPIRVYAADIKGFTSSNSCVHSLNKLPSKRSWSSLVDAGESYIHRYQLQKRRLDSVWPSGLFPNYKHKGMYFTISWQVAYYASKQCQGSTPGLSAFLALIGRKQSNGWRNGGWWCSINIPNNKEWEAAVLKTFEQPSERAKNPLGVHTKPLLGGTNKAKTGSWVYFTEFG